MNVRIAGLRLCFAAMVLMPLVSACDGEQQPASFVNWETPHVHPLAMTPDGGMLLAVNTPDNRLELFSLDGESPVPIGDVPVGLDPVSVRARTNTEAWVVNHISDSVSIVDLEARNVVGTLNVGDEPCDVVFAGDPQRAFVSLSQENAIKVYDPADLSAPPLIIPIEGEDPRALATDGRRVFAAIFESGNATTLVPHQAVSHAEGPYAGANPPPNNGSKFSPAKAFADPAAPPVGQIVRKIEGQWLDTNGADWSAYIPWDLHDHDVAVIDVASLEVTYASGLMNLDMNLAVHPSGRVTVVGSEAINDVRFEPNVRGIFARMVMASFDPADPASSALVDLNPHLDYAVASIPAEARALSISEPRDIVWNSAGDAAYVAGMGSDNVVVLGEKGARLAQIAVPAGPTGLVLDESRNRLYVLSKFDAAISTIDLADNTVTSTANLFDPTPEVIKKGRPHLYNATKSSGLGHLSCATCHVDARMDQLAWDLGDPAGEIKEFNQTCNIGLLQLECKDWHPMKGPMTTQTLIGTVGNRPLHWRGDREDIAAFNGAFESLLVAESLLSDAEMAEFEAFLATIVHPPNPNRLLDGSLRDAMQLRGKPASPSRGFELFQNAPSDQDFLKCVDCHALPQGVLPVVVGGGILASPQQAVISQLENTYEKTGFDVTSRNNNRGFGLTHDGAFDHVANFLTHPVFTLPTDQDRLDLEAFVLSFSTTTHATVGRQVTLNGNPATDAASAKLLDDLRREADELRCGLVARGRRDGKMRGFVYRQGTGDFETDGDPATIAYADLVASAKQGAELTFTAVPIGAERRIAFDRDEDGVPDAADADTANGRAIGREWFPHAAG